MFVGYTEQEDAGSTLAAGLRGPKLGVHFVPPVSLLVGVDANGRERWRHRLQRTDDLARSLPLGISALGRHVIVATPSMIAGLDAASGTLAWSAPMPGASTHAPLLAAGAARIASTTTGASEVRLIAPDSGAVTKVVTLPGEVVRMSAQGDHLAVIVSRGASTELVDIDLASERIAWTAPLPAPADALQPTKELAIVRTADGFARSYEWQGGKLAWTVDVDLDAFRAVGTDAGLVLLRSLEREIVATKPTRSLPSPREIQVDGTCRVHDWVETRRILPPNACNGATVTAGARSARVGSDGRFHLGGLAITRLHLKLETPARARAQSCDPMVATTRLDTTDGRARYVVTIDIPCRSRRE